MIILPSISSWILSNTAPPKFMHSNFKKKNPISAVHMCMVVEPPIGGAHTTYKHGHPLGKNDSLFHQQPSVASNSSSRCGPCELLSDSCWDLFYILIIYTHYIPTTISSTSCPPSFPPPPQIHSFSACLQEKKKQAS